MVPINNSLKCDVIDATNLNMKEKTFISCSYWFYVGATGDLKRKPFWYVKTPCSRTLST